MESLRIIPGLVFSAKADLDSTVLCLSKLGLGLDHIRPRPIFSKISDKLTSISSRVIFQLLQEAIVFSQETIFFRSNRQETIHDAWCYNIFLRPGQARRFEMDFASLEQVSIGAILGYRKTCA